MADSSESIHELYDLAVVGCGPAGLAAALNGTIRKKKIFLFGTDFCSPKLHHAPKIENYLGLPNITGEELRKKFLAHLQEVKLKVNQNKISGIYPEGENFTLQSRDKFFKARAVILATGVNTVKPIQRELDYLGRGVSYCATCDGPLYKDRKVIVLAYNRDGLEEANFLSEIASEVLLVPLLKEEEAARVRLNEKIKVVKGKAMGITGEMWATGVALEDQQLTADGVFIVRESVLPDQLVPGLKVGSQGIEVDRWGATNIPGVFAAGDCTGAPYQLSKATGEGQVAALSAAKYLDELKSKVKEDRPLATV